jgi:hypothetical protein
MSMLNEERTMSEDEERAALQESIERNETELRNAVDDLTHAVKRELTIGNRVAENPFAWVLGAFLVGMWLGRTTN